MTKLSPCLFLLILVSSSCAWFSPKQAYTPLRLIEGIPFYPQEAYQCGPASLAGVLNYWGVEVSPEEIASEIYSKTAKGTWTTDMVSYAERAGLKAQRFGGSFENIKRNIDEGYPLIVLVDYGFWFRHQYHFMVVLGYIEDGVIVNSGKNRHKLIGRDRFLRTWKKKEFWTLLVAPHHKPEGR